MTFNINKIENIDQQKLYYFQYEPKTKKSMAKNHGLDTL